MCLAIPAQVKELDEKQMMGVVDILGVTREVALDLVPKVKVGDYVLVHAGYGIQIVDEQFANETLDLIRQFPDLIDEDNPGMGIGAA
jgi:hydrogenase expression/formation protein HypC